MFYVFIAIFLLLGMVTLGGLWVVGALGSPAVVSKPRGALPQKGEEYLRGEDLKRYPRRLWELERLLERSHRATEEQIEHLDTRREQMQAKEGRAELADRYRADVEALAQRAAAIRRVLATVWKTRAVLHLRVNLAIVARQRPQIDHLPPPLDVRPEGLEEAAEGYTQACREVRAFVTRIDEATEALDAGAPEPPPLAEVAKEHERTVADEVQHTRRTLAELREKMDQLSDNLEYLADRFRTQRVVEGAPLSLDVGPEANQVLSEVSAALGQLEALSAVGDKGLAEAAVDGLTEDISRLEQAGLEAQAEVEAQREVQRLLEQFSR